MSKYMNQQNQPNQSNIPQEPQQPQPSIQPETSQKPHLPTLATVLIVVLSVVVIGLVSYGAYRYFALQPEPTELPATGEEEPVSAYLPTGEEVEEPVDETANWQTYRNEKYRFEVKYPNNIIAGQQAPNSVLGSFDYPIGGIYIGPLVFIVLDSSTLKQKATTYFNSYYEKALHANNGLDETTGPSINCEIERIDNTLIQAVQCSGSGGPAFYAYIKGTNLDIFIDGYSSGYAHQYNVDANVGSFQGKNEINQVLSTFKFIEAGIDTSD